MKTLNRRLMCIIEASEGDGVLVWFAGCRWSPHNQGCVMWNHLCITTPCNFHYLHTTLWCGHNGITLVECQGINKIQHNMIQDHYKLWRDRVQIKQLDKNGEFPANSHWLAPPAPLHPTHCSCQTSLNLSYATLSDALCRTEEAVCVCVCVWGGGGGHSN